MKRVKDLITALGYVMNGGAGALVSIIVKTLARNVNIFETFYPTFILLMPAKTPPLSLQTVYLIQTPPPPPGT